MSPRIGLFLHKNYIDFIQMSNYWSMSLQGADPLLTVLVLLKSMVYQYEAPKCLRQNW